MRNAKCILVVSVVAALLVNSAMAQQAAPPTSWDAVKQATGSSVQVVLANGGNQTGRLEQVTDTAVVVVSKPGSSTIMRDDISRVYLVKRQSRKQAVLIGLGVGAGAGAIIGATGTQPCRTGEFCIISISRGEGAAIVGLVGAVVGSITGLLISFGHRHQVLYQR